jgi:hypothetical protein
LAIITLARLEPRSVIMSHIPIPVLEARTGADSDVRDAERTRNFYRALLRIVGELVRGALIMSLGLALSGDIAHAGVLTRHKLPMQPIVNGHHVQPRADRLQALGYSDLTPQQTDEVERLYQQLLQKSMRQIG